ncbi:MULTISPECIES: ABC transporter ATP-binding protein [Microbacterium]|uniref:ABC transporter ATP-binding protein n=1 Tax=Microbacterium TaxID=33882 RepID=UPI00344D02E5
MAIEFRSVTKRFGDGPAAVDEVTLEMPARKTTVLVGSSGCGKTTLLRMINSLIEPTSGDITIDGESIHAKDAVQLRRSIGYVLQNAGLLPHYTVADNIATVPVLTGQTKAAARRRALELMEVVGLDAAFADRYPAQLSGGQQQRVGVARALAADPNILLMDEPFGAVDPIVRKELQAEVIRLQRELDKTIVFVTHDIDEAFLLGDQVVILQKGAHIAQRGTPSEIIESPADDFVATFIGTDRGARAFRAKETPRGTVLVDGAGRTQGVLVSDAAEDPR